jgi:hypothetical protein
MKLPNPDLWALFHSECRLRTDAGDLEVAIQHTDPVVLPSGRLVVGDAIVDIYNSEPLVPTLPAGRYGVRLATATGLDGVVASFVRIGLGTAIRWEPADPHCHSVDSGTSGLMDYKLARRIGKRSEEWFERHLNRCTNALACSNELWANRRSDRETGANLLFFRTATGDGDYGSFFGYSDSGDLVCLVTDFWLEAAVREIVTTATP